MAASETLQRVPVGAADVEAALALSDAAGWNQTGDDWRVFIHHGCVWGQRDARGTLVATAAALPYTGGMGWISMVLVHEAWRHRGLATALLHGCIEWLGERNLVPLLDATPAGEAVYRRLGFETGLAFERWQATLPEGEPARQPPAAALREAGEDDIDAVAELDSAASRIGRRFLIDAFMSRSSSRAWITGDGSGFVLRRDGRRAAQIGPLVAADAGSALELLDAALASLHGPVFLDVLARRESLLERLRARGFSRQRPFVRMALGSSAALAGSSRQFVMAGPEFG